MNKTIFISVVFMLLGMFLFTMGFHAIDNSHNLSIVMLTTGQEWTDNTVLGIPYSMIGVYSTGIFESFLSLVLFFSAYALLLKQNVKDVKTHEKKH